MRPAVRRKRRGNEGFALLLIFLMAAVVAITLYMEIPRVAFATQRQKEQLLIERGEQYKIAIRRFYQANNRWPAKIEDLENTNNRRFLRHRYIDPMTGKDEWRAVHIQNGVLTDSVNNKQQQKKKDDQGPSQGLVAEFASPDVSGQGQTTANPALRRRPSEGGAVPTDAFGQPIQNPTANPVLNSGLPPGVPGVPGIPGAVPPNTPGGSVGGAPVPGMGAIPLPPGTPGAPNPAAGTGGLVGSMGGVGSQPNNPTGQPGVYAGQTQFPGLPGNPVNSQAGGVSPYNTAPGANGAAPGYPQPGANTGAQPGQSNAAIGMINQILTSPRPGGLAGLQNAPNGMPGQTIGGGIAGFASTLDADSIMVYNDHTDYAQWEFIFDPTKWHAPPNPNQGTVGTSISSIGSMPGPNTGTPVSAMGSMGASPMGASPVGGAMGMAGGPGTMPGPGSTFGAGGFGQSGQQPGQQPGQPGQTPMTSSGFGGGGLVEIRPGRR